jgi:hypothetical protein
MTWSELRRARGIFTGRRSGGSGTAGPVCPTIQGVAVY